MDLRGWLARRGAHLHRLHDVARPFTVPVPHPAGCPRPMLQVAAVPAEDQAAMERINDWPSFPNPLPVEFGLLLRRAWKQQSRDRLPQVRGLGCFPCMWVAAGKAAQGCGGWGGMHHALLLDQLP